MTEDAAREAYEAVRGMLKAGDFAGAIAQLEASVAEYPHFKALELLGEAWLRSGNPGRAVVPLAAATTLNMQVRAPSLLAEAFLALGQELDAHRIVQLALDRSPHNRKARTVLELTEPAYRRWTAPPSSPVF